MNNIKSSQHDVFPAENKISGKCLQAYTLLYLPSVHTWTYSEVMCGNLIFRNSLSSHSLALAHKHSNVCILCRVNGLTWQQRWMLSMSPGFHQSRGQSQCILTRNPTGLTCLLQTSSQPAALSQQHQAVCHPSRPPPLHLHHQANCFLLQHQTPVWRHQLAAHCCQVAVCLQPQTEFCQQ